ncbi:MAG: phosphocholine cytidylyltransferase family protein [Patescibacteria group bacterium]
MDQIKHALILAAGRGRRLMPYTARRPKCLVEVGGRPLLFYQLRALELCGITDVTIVAGYLQDLIREYTRRYFPHFSISFIINDRYETTNDIYSFALAKDFAGESFVQIDSDLLFHPGILGNILSANTGDSLTYVSRAPCGDEEMKVILDENMFIKKIGKAIKPEDAHGEFMSISLFRKPFSARLFTVMDEMIKGGGEMRYSGEAMSKVCEEGLPLCAADIQLPAIEIDFPEDLNNATNVILPKIIDAYK